MSLYVFFFSPFAPKFESLAVPTNNEVHIKKLEEDNNAFITELTPFLWDSGDSSKIGSNDSSRALAIIGTSGLPISKVRSTSETFGSLLYFRQEFFQSRGVILLAYHDLRSARSAAKDLNSYLQRLLCSHMQHSHQSTVKVMYCVDLNSSTTINESVP